jgi:hypothetical protein
MRRHSPKTKNRFDRSTVELSSRTNQSITNYILLLAYHAPRNQSPCCMSERAREPNITCTYLDSSSRQLARSTTWPRQFYKFPRLSGSGPTLAACTYQLTLIFFTRDIAVCSILITIHHINSIHITFSLYTLLLLLLLLLLRLFSQFKLKRMHLCL